MILLDHVVAWDESALTASVTIRSDTRFRGADGSVPAHVAIEWMAQACGAFAGLEARTQGLPVRLGFLLGTRRFRASRPGFAEGERFLVLAKQIFREGGMGKFDCVVRAADGEDVAHAQLTVFQPAETDPAGTPTERTS
jgi:predicted hotdog family 3-hydroxylacyl-ACP dehydratase